MACLWLSLSYCRAHYVTSGAHVVQSTAHERVRIVNTFEAAMA